MIALRYLKVYENYSGRHKGTEHQRHKVGSSEDNELFKFIDVYKAVFGQLVSCAF
jgi:hypothetical protein